MFTVLSIYIVGLNIITVLSLYLDERKGVQENTSLRSRGYIFRYCPVDEAIRHPIDQVENSFVAAL